MKGRILNNCKQAHNFPKVQDREILHTYLDNEWAVINVAYPSNTLTLNTAHTSQDNDLKMCLQAQISVKVAILFKIVRDDTFWGLNLKNVDYDKLCKRELH